MFNKPIAAVCLFAVFALSISAVKADEMVPFTGTWTGVTVSADLTNFPIVAVVAEGGGQTSHLGSYAMRSPHTTHVFTGETIGEQIFTAANGDTLTAYCEGSPQPNQDGSVVIGSLECAFTSGSGRFEGVSGSYEFFLVATILPDGSGYSTVAEIDGTISTVGSNQ
jgi:hypothetical protein